MLNSKSAKRNYPRNMLNSEKCTEVIKGQCTVVDMPQSAFHELKDQEGLKIKGKSLKIRKYSRSEEEKKAKAIKKLKQDRR